MTTVVPLNSNYTDFQGLAKLRLNAATNNPAAMREVGKQFEALLIQMTLQSMREATPSDPLFGNNAENLYRDLYDKQISMNIAEKSQLGLADMIVRQLQHYAPAQTSAQNTSANSSVQSAPAQAPVQNKTVNNSLPSMPAQSSAQNKKVNSSLQLAPSTAQGVGTLAPPKKAAFASPAAFVKELWPYAQAAASQLKVDPKVLVAQAALETGWGQNVISQPDGRSSNNLFGIKAGDGWQQGTATVPTQEYHDGAAVTVPGTFRSYPSLADGLQDYVHFLQDNPRYKDALAAAASPEQFVNALQNAGYATDPHYAEKIRDVMGGVTLASSLPGLKQNGADPIG